MTSFISPARKCLEESYPLFFPFGAKQSRNVLKDFKGIQRTKLKVLFLGCYDLRNVIFTAASEVNSGVDLLTIHLNHPCPLSLARNALILKVISAPNFNIDDAVDLNYLWDVWYNFEWPQTTLDRFVDDVECLVAEGFPENSSLDINQLNSLKDIWSSWLMSLRETLTQPIQMEKVSKNREEFITSCGYGKELCKTIAGDGEGYTFSEAVGIYSMWCESKMETENFPASLKKMIAKEATTYFTTGNCNATKLLKSAAINPTLLEPKTLRWWVEVSSCPFDGYLPLLLCELDTKAKEGIATRFCQKKLKSLVNTFRQMKKYVEFHFHLGEDLQFCHIGTTEKFDVIDSSSLADKLGLANLIALSSQRLDLNPNAFLLTESDSWSNLGPTVLQYVEESLCTPVNMIPTLYGLRLANHVELGATALMEMESPTGSPHITLTWHQAPRFENVPLSFSPSLDRCMEKLKRKCYFIEGEKSFSSSKNCGLARYTPLTYYYVTNNLAHRTGNVSDAAWLKCSHFQLPSRFIMTENILDSWGSCNSVKLVTSVIPFGAVQKYLFEQAKIMYPAPMLRIVLIPTEYFCKLVEEFSENKGLKFPIVWGADNSNVHYIDNFHLRYNQSKNGSCCSAQVSFVLPLKHDLSHDHVAILIEMVSGTLVMTIGEIEEMKETIIKKNSSSARELSPERFQQDHPYMKVVDCQESENDYTVEIRIQTSKHDPKGLTITTDRQLPCEAAHRITFSLAQPEGIKPLTLCFPYPFLVDWVDTTLRRSDRLIKVLLKKASNEPWPCHFSEKPKWKVDNFKSWNSKESHLDTTHLLMLHIGAQKIGESMENLFETIRLVHFPKYRLLPPLEIVRNAIENMFTAAFDCGEYFCVSKVPAPRTSAEFLSGAMGIENQESLFTIRAHLPVLISPFGSPMLLITILDECLSKKLIEKGHLKKKQAEEDFQRVFCGKKKNNPKILWVTENSINFLRYVLRLNSTQMEPSGWQENNLPLGKYSPYLATYISPLYLDNLFPQKKNDAKDS